MLYTPNKNSRTSQGYNWSTSYYQISCGTCFPAQLTNVELATGTALTWLFQASEDIYGYNVHFSIGRTSYVHNCFQMVISSDGLNEVIPTTPGIPFSGIPCSPAYAESPRQYYFPLFVPKGYYLGIRMIGTSTDYINVGITYDINHSDPASTKVGSYYEKIGDPYNNNDYYGQRCGITADSYTYLGDTTRDLWYIGLAHTVLDSTQTTDWEAIGLYRGDGGGNYSPIHTQIITRLNTSERNTATSLSPYMSGIEKFVPAGTSLYVRLYGPTSFSSEVTAVAYGFGG